MRKSVNGGGGEYRLVEELGPLAKGPVGGQDCRSSLVPTVDDFIKILRSRGSHGFQSKVVENDHVGALGLDHLEARVPLQGGNYGGVGPAHLKGQ